MSKLTCLLITLLPSLALAEEPKKQAPPPTTPPAVKAPPPATPPKPTPPKPPAETTQTVAMFKGNWNFDATLTATGMPGFEKPIKAKLAMPCKAIAGGTAVACDGKMKTALGPFDGHFVIAWDPYSKAVHFIGVTNNYEVHDHVCGQWDQGMAGKSGLSCTPLKGGSGPAGDEINEDVTFAFHKDGKELEFTSTMKMKNGATLTFAGKGKK
jgi:hypothetical protein